MDHVVSPRAWQQAGVPYENARFLERGPGVQGADGEPGPRVTEVSIGSSAEPASEPASLPLGISEAQVAERLLGLAQAPVLRLQHTRGLLCGLKSDSLRRRMGLLTAQGLLTPPPWCSTCFRPCKVELRTWLDEAAISKGADGANRWCAHFESPPPLPPSDEGC